jgi:hypothetical protein
MNLSFRLQIIHFIAFYVNALLWIDIGRMRYDIGRMLFVPIFFNILRFLQIILKHFSTIIQSITLLNINFAYCRFLSFYGINSRSHSK